MTRTMFRTRIKFCGLTRLGDVRLASELGADAVGFVFAHDSPRRVRPEQARAMRNGLTPLVDVIALFMDNPAEEIQHAVRLVRPNLLQFHGDEPDAFCRSFGLPYLKVVALGGDANCGDAEALLLRYPSAAGFLFDGHAPGEAGGRGHVFPWSKIPTGLNRPFMLAGGLTPENVFDAIQSTMPWGVDSSTGIERSPGIKDGEKMRRFVEEVRRSDCQGDADLDLEAACLVGS